MTTANYAQRSITDKDIIKHNLATAMRNSGLTPTQLADKTGLKRPAISRALSKGHGIGPLGWRKIAQVLGVSVESLFGLQRSPEPLFLPKS